MNAAVLEFDEPGRPLSTTPGGMAGADAPTVIAETLRTNGIDAPSTLYNEALVLARDGLLGAAAQRLQMLVCLDPDDADGHILLAKVYAAQGRSTEALARLEAGIEAGAVAPAGLREHLEGQIRAERTKDEEHRARVAAREQGEIKALRQEARNLRSETIRLEAEVTETREREKLWRGAIAVVASLAACAVIVFGLVMMFQTPDAPKPAAPVAAAPKPASPPLEVMDLSEPPGAATTAVQVTPPKPAPTAAVAPAAVAPAAAPTAAAPSTAAERVTLPTHHVVVSGDTLYTLAGRYYGDRTQYEKIKNANKKVLKNGIALKLGMELTIPK